MKQWFTIFLVLVGLTSNAQQAPKNKWEYGIHLHFNSGFIKPVAADTFTNKAGFGGGLLLERKFKNMGLQVIPSFVQTRYSNDIANRISITNSIDFAINTVFPLDQKKQTWLIGGVVASYTLQHIEQNLDGSQIRTGLHNTLILDQPFDAGLRIGFGLDLSPGSRLTLTYSDFFNGSQTSGNISGKIDYFQLGVQLRLVELMNSDRVNKKFAAQKERIARAQNQATSLKAGNDGLLVFVLAPLKKKYVGKQTAFKDSLFKDRQLAIRSAVISAIKTQYTHGDYLITTDSLFGLRTANRIQVMENGSTGVRQIPPGRTLFFSKIDELFIEDNGNLKWGIFSFDKDMNLLEDPFPYYIPYRHLDKDFEVANTMIYEFNGKLKLLSAK